MGARTDARSTGPPRQGDYEHREHAEFVEQAIELWCTEALLYRNGNSQDTPDDGYKADQEERGPP